MPNPLCVLFANLEYSFVVKTIPSAYAIKKTTSLNRTAFKSKNQETKTFDNYQQNLTHILNPPVLALSHHSYGYITIM